MIDPYDLGGGLEAEPPSPPPRPDSRPIPIVIQPASPTIPGSLWSRVRGSLVPVLLVAAIVGLLSANLWQLWRDRAPTPAPNPPTPIADYDPAFVPFGKAYAKALGPAFAKALEDGAKLLDAGQPRTPAEDTTQTAFKANREADFEKLIGPEIEKLSPTDVPDEKLTSEQNKALARAMRGLAKGASNP